LNLATILFATNTCGRQVQAKTRTLKSLADLSVYHLR
jgi:hypothetical protein